MAISHRINNLIYQLYNVLLSDLPDVFNLNLCALFRHFSLQIASLHSNSTRNLALRCLLHDGVNVNEKALQRELNPCKWLFHIG
jgi:hypothetical protein